MTPYRDHVGILLRYYKITRLMAFGRLDIDYIVILQYCNKSGKYHDIEILQYHIIALPNGP